MQTPVLLLLVASSLCAAPIPIFVTNEVPIVGTANDDWESKITIIGDVVDYSQYTGPPDVSISLTRKITFPALPPGAVFVTAAATIWGMLNFGIGFSEVTPLGPGDYKAAEVLTHYNPSFAIGNIPELASGPFGTAGNAPVGLGIALIPNPSAAGKTVTVDIVIEMSPPELMDIHLGFNSKTVYGYRGPQTYDLTLAAQIEYFFPTPEPSSVMMAALAVAAAAFAQRLRGRLSADAQERR